MIQLLLLLTLLSLGQSAPTSPLNYNVHVFYYPWYGWPSFSKQWFHWNQHQQTHGMDQSKWGKGSKEDKLTLKLMNAAHKNNIKVRFHIEPYHNRTGQTIVDHVAYTH